MASTFRQMCSVHTTTVCGAQSQRSSHYKMAACKAQARQFGPDKTSLALDVYRHLMSGESRLGL